MDTENLQKQHHLLLEYLQKRSSKRYVDAIRGTIRFVLEYGPKCDSYKEIFLLLERRLKGKVKPKTIRSHGQRIGIVERFDLYGKYPTRRIHNKFITYVIDEPQLSVEFSFLIDNYQSKASEVLGHQKERIVSYTNVGKDFFNHLQSRGAYTLHETSVTDVASFFYDGTKPVKGKSHKMAIRAIMRCVKNELRTVALDFMDKLPYIPRKMTNYQFMTREESEKMVKAITDENNGLSLLDKALAAVSYFDGLRSTDVTALTMDNIDFERDIIKITQIKTGNTLELPLSAMVGNAILEYITKERPKSKDNTIFVHPTNPTDRFSSIWYHLKNVFNAAGVRQNGGGPVGSRLLRHRIATYLLSKKITQPVISSILGHIQPQSLNHYIDSDIEHLREFAIDVTPYPINPQLLELWPK